MGRGRSRPRRGPPSGAGDPLEAAARPDPPRASVINATTREDRAAGKKIPGDEDSSKGFIDGAYPTFGVTLPAPGNLAEGWGKA